LSEKENLPEIRRRPDERALRHTTLFPLNLPARRISTVPGVIEERTLGALRTGVGPLEVTWSSAG